MLSKSPLASVAARSRASTVSISRFLFRRAVTVASIALAIFVAPNASAQLVLFPNSLSAVTDNVSPDTCPATNVICVASLALPADASSTAVHPDLEFTGEVHANFTGPTTTTGGTASITVTNGYIENTGSTLATIGSTPFNATDYSSMLEIAFFTHPALSGPGSVSTTINGTFGTGPPVPTGPGSNGTMFQQIHLGTSDTMFTPTGSFNFATAQWVRPSGTLTGPVAMSASGSIPGSFAGGTAMLQIHVDDALTLDGGDVMYFPTSVHAMAQGAPIPEPASSMMLLAVLVLAPLLARWKRH